MMAIENPDGKRKQVTANLSYYQKPLGTNSVLFISEGRKSNGLYLDYLRYMLRYVS